MIPIVQEEKQSTYKSSDVVEVALLPRGRTGIGAPGLYRASHQGLGKAYAASGEP